MPSGKITFLNGNKNTPALLVGDDPSNGEEGYEEQDNILIVPLGVAQSVPRDSVSETEGTPNAEEASASGGSSGS